MKRIPVHSRWFPVRINRHLIIPLVMAAALASCARTTDHVAPKAVNGVLDLREWDFERDGSVLLNGQWEVIWGLLPDDTGRISTPGSAPATAYLEVPGSWTGQSASGVTLPATGYATYRLRVLTRPGQVALAVRTLSAGTAFTLWVEGKRVAANGAVGTTAAASDPEFRNGLSLLPPLPASSEWTLAISNFHYRKGGPWNPIELGPAKDLVTSSKEAGAFDQFLMGSLIIMGVYHLVLFGLRRQDRSALWFGLFCIDTALRQASVGERELRYLWADVPWSVLIRIEFISFFALIVFGSLFARTLFPAELFAHMERVLVRVGVTAIVLTLVMPVRWSSHLINPYQFWTLGVCAYLLWGIGRAVLHKRDGSYIFLAGTAVLGAAGVNDVLYNLEVFRFAYLFSVGLVVFNFAQALVLSRRFVKATVTAETLTESLELKVEERTQELAAKNQQLEATIDDLRTTKNQLRQVGLSVRIGADYLVFPYGDVHYLTAHEGKTVIHTRDKAHEVARPLKEIESLLSDEVFQRIHRQCIVNIHYVANMAHIGSGGYIAVLRGRPDAPLPVSRVHAPLLKQRLGIVE